MRFFAVFPSGTRKNNSPGWPGAGTTSTESPCGMSPSRTSRLSSAAQNAASACGSHASKVISWISRAPCPLSVITPRKPCGGAGQRYRKTSKILVHTAVLYASFMRAGFSTIPRTGHLVTRAARRRPRGSRLIWIIVLALAIVSCAEAIAIPAKRPGLACALVGLFGLGLWATGRQRQHRERTALAARLAALSGDDIPVDVLGLVAAGKKISAVKRYRELTGAGLREAKAVIDGL
jgi:ribosomal protein L7/L12